LPGEAVVEYLVISHILILGLGFWLGWICKKQALRRNGNGV
jgi:hypothetical protein